MKLIELTVVLDKGKLIQSNVAMAFKLDHIAYMGESRHNKKQCWMRLSSGDFINVLCPYPELLFAIRNELQSD